MKKVYIYESDDGFDLFLTAEELIEEERYCSHCGEYSELKGVTSNIDDLLKLFEDYGYTPNCAKYQELLLQFNNIVGGNNDKDYSR